MAYRPMPPWQVLESRAIIEKRWLTVLEERLVLPNGHEIEEFHRIVAPSWSAVLALTDDERVVLVRQYRHGMAGESLELPAGVIEPHESPMEAAVRELTEETGYVAERFVPIGSVWTEPSRHTVRAHFFCAYGARPIGARALDASEDISLETVPKAKLFELCQSGGIVHGVHVGAILLAERLGLLGEDRG